MAGSRNSRKKLNNTLLFIIKLLNLNNFDNWFVGYGTLLGIVRENNCIEGDDDVDIIIDSKHYEALKKIIINEGIKIETGYGIKNSKNILKTKVTDKYTSVDFYMANISPNGDFVDLWERVNWSSCYQDGALIEKKWNDETLYLPNNYETKLINRYGKSWKTPQNTKGPRPPKKVI